MSFAFKIPLCLCLLAIGCHCASVLVWVFNPAWVWRSRLKSVSQVLCSLAETRPLSHSWELQPHPLFALTCLHRSETFAPGSRGLRHTTQGFSLVYSFWALAWICDIVLPSSSLIVSFIVSSARKFICEFFISAYVRVFLVKFCLIISSIFLTVLTFFLSLCLMIPTSGSPVKSRGNNFRLFLRSSWEELLFSLCWAVRFWINHLLSLRDWHVLELLFHLDEDVSISAPSLLLRCSPPGEPTGLISRVFTRTLLLPQAPISNFCLWIHTAVKALVSLSDSQLSLCIYSPSVLPPQIL